MPGGYGTSGPWGSAGTSYVSPGQSSSPYRPGGGSTNQGGSNAVADYYNQVQYEKSPEYLNNPENFSNPYEQAAASYQAAGAVTSGALGGTALWTQAPRLPDGSIDYAKQNLIDKYDNVYYSSFAPGTDAYSPTGLIAISKDPVTGEVSHHVVGGSSSHQGGGGGGGDYAAGIAAGLGRRPKQLGDEEAIPKGLRLLQYMVNVHKNNPYTKMAIRRKNGGIVSLVGG